MSKRTKFHQQYKHRITGKPVPGSTTILKNVGWSSEVLIGWARKVAMAGDDPYKVRDDAGELGTIVHEMIEDHLCKEYGVGDFAFDPDDYPPVLVEKGVLGFEAYLKWENSLPSFKPLESEIQLAHHDLLYGGTIDMIAEIDGVLTFIDFKTSAGVYKTHVMQIESYKQMYMSILPDVVDLSDAPILILHISKKTGQCTPYTFEHHQMGTSWETFQLALRMHYAKEDVPGL